VDTLQFLRAIWPSNGYYLILIPTQFKDRATGEVRKSFKHFAFSSIEEAHNAALSLANDRDNPVDVYFAMATVKEDLTRMRKEDRDALGKKIRGVHRQTRHDNTCEVKAFWLDLDVKADPKAYATPAEAASELRAFCSAMGLPRPLVTSSGGGLHVYWPLTTPLDPDKWQHYASILKQLTESWGLRADASRTADRASVLRPVGTHNWKTGTPRTVQVVVESQPVPTDQFLQRLSYLVETMNLPPVQVPRHQMVVPQGMPLAGTPLQGAVDAAAMNEAAAAGAGYEPADPREVVAKCPQLAWQATHQAEVDEPLWYAMIGCLRHAKDGAKAVHFMSRQSPDYDVFVTDAKIRQHEDGGFPPTLCATFEQHRPGGCDGCPFKGKIKTPLQVVRKLEQVAPPTVQLTVAPGVTQSVALPPPPPPYKRVINPMTGTARIAMTIGDKDGVEEDVVLYEYDLYPSRLVFDERENRYNVVVHRWLPQDGWSEFDLPTGSLYDRRHLAVTLGNIGVMPDLGHVENIVSYLVAYIRDLQKVAAASTIYAQLGWRPELDKFILPDRAITASATTTHAVSRNIANALSWAEPRGDLEVWKQIVATYERPGMEAHQFGFGVGFGSPLFTFTNFGGMLVSMIGERGAGKSSAAMSANSIYGHPKMGWADRENDTARAFVQKLGVLNNLPATYDEHTNLDGDMVSDLCYMVSKGQGRQRLMQNGEVAQNHGNWQLMMLMTGNRSLNARLATVKADASAESARVFEYHVPANTLTKAEADLNWGPGGRIFDHFGVAAEPYLRHLIQNQEWAKDRVRHWVQEVDRAAQVSSGERFWSAGVACVLTGFELANQCGLTNADIDRLFRFAVRVIHGMRAEVEENTRTPVGLVSEYINSNLRSMIILTSDANQAGLAQVQHAPSSDRLRIRLERHSGRLFIDRADFRRFCAAQQVDPNVVQRELLASGVLRSKDIRIVLGRDTPFRTAQTICWLLDGNAPALAGVGDLNAVPSAQAQPAQVAAP